MRQHDDERTFIYCRSVAVAAAATQDAKTIAPDAISARDATCLPRMYAASQCNDARKFLDSVQQAVAVLDDLLVPAAMRH